MEQWEIDLNNQLSDSKQQIIIVKPKKSSSSLLIFIFFIMIFLFCGVFAYKKIHGFKNWIGEHFKIEKIKEITQDENMSEKIWKKIEIIEDELKKNSKKVNLLGISHNENFSQMNKNNPSANYMLLNHDWSLNRKPENIEINDDDKKFIDDSTKN